MTGLTANLR